MYTNEPPRRTGTRRALLWYYRCFLLHFVLGCGASLLLLLSVLRLGTMLPQADATMRAALAHSLTPTSLYRRRAAAPALLSLSFYCTGGTADAFFDLTEKEELTVTLPQGGDVSDAPPDQVPPLPEQSAPVPPQLSPPDTAPTPPAQDGPETPPAGHTPLRTVDLSQRHLFTSENKGVLFSNQTSYVLSADTYFERPYPIAPPDIPTSSMGEAAVQPLVLILHTHGTESYAPDGAQSVEAGYSYRSQDTDKNVVSVGAVLTETLRNAGIGVIHCQTMFDADSYADSYANSAAYIKEMLQKYPSIRYVFDVHRDALSDGDGTVLRPITEIGGEVCAQVMLVVGTDEGGAYHPGWRGNLTVAVHLQSRMNTNTPGLARPINLRQATFNAQYAPGSLLLEIGAAANSVEEARSAAYHLGIQLAPLILGAP